MGSLYLSSLFFQIKKKLENKRFPASLIILDNYKVQNNLLLNCKKEDKFQAASISKTLTSLLTLRLEQEGLLNINEDVNGYLNSYKLTDGKGNVVKTTLNQLLTHTAGCTVEGFPGYSLDSKLPSLDQILEGEKPCNTGKVIIDEKIRHTAGYSGGGFMIIQKVIEDVTGKKFEELAEEKIFRSLSMNNSDFKDRKVKDSKIYPEKAAAGLWTTTEDLAKLLVEIQLSYEGKSNKILNKKMMRKMLKPYIVDGDYLVGLGIYLTKNKKLFFHNGRNYNSQSKMWGSIKGGKGLIFLAKSEEDYEFITRSLVKS